MDCYACDQEATASCSLCGNLYCGAHGDDICADCLNPVNAAPSGAVFRISILALLFASVLALWLLVRPPSIPGQLSEVSLPDPTPGPGPSVSSPTATPTPIPTLPPPATPTPTLTPTLTPTQTPEPTPIAYTVVEGDTFYGIADVFGVDAEELATVNGLTLESLIQVGQILVIPTVASEATPTATPAPSPTATPVPTADGPLEYTVVEGDTLYGIADSFGVSIEDLLAVNGLTEDDLLHPGDVLVIPQ